MNEKKYEERAVLKDKVLQLVETVKTYNESEGKQTSCGYSQKKTKETQLLFCRKWRVTGLSLLNIFHPLRLNVQ